MHNYFFESDLDLNTVEEPGILLPGERSSNPIVEKSNSFALKIISLYKEMKSQKEFTLSRQILRCGTSIGAHVQESQSAQSKKDFVFKIRISLKEARECRYWLLLISDSKIVNIDCAKEIENCDELIRILFAILKKSNENNA